MDRRSEDGQPVDLKPMEPLDLLDRLKRDDVVLIDVRRHPGAEQIYGAIRYNPHDLLAVPRLILPLPKSGDPPIVLYDETGDGSELRAIGAKLRESGYTSLFWLVGGFAAWRAAAHRVEERSLEQPIPGVEKPPFER